jgi:hypothetical protein
VIAALHDSGEPEEPVFAGNGPGLVYLRDRG